MQLEMRTVLRTVENPETRTARNSASNRGIFLTRDGEYSDRSIRKPLRTLYMT